MVRKCRPEMAMVNELVFDCACQQGFVIPAALCDVHSIKRVYRGTRLKIQDTPTVYDNVS